MESRLGTSFADVRVHTGAAAAAAARAEGANAYAIGDDIVVGNEQFDPHGAAGRRLLAHELVHVTQQRAGRAGAPVAVPAQAEQEARRLAPLIAAGQAVRVTQAAPAALQRDGPGPAGGDSSTTLTLDPDLEARMAFERWLAQQAAGGSTATESPGLQPLPTAWLRPSLLGAERTDFGSLITPYYDRGLMPGGAADTRDLGVITQLFNERYQLVRHFPDVGPVVRPFLGADWRVRLAETLTATSVDFALSGDHPTTFELSNRSWERMTGATTYSTPMFKVPLVNDWWNRVSGSGR